MEIQHHQYSPIVPPKSPNDQRKYEAVTLKNNLKLLFIQDSTLQKSACSISVGTGSLQDPEQSLGLAHFLQHMLFMGSKKFPIHNEYSSFINQNSGMDNAYTSDVQTNYYFEISNAAFNQAVQRITNFFTGALLTQSCITKQTQAVHQQYVLWTNDDNCRKWEIIKKLAKGPYHRFSIGNNDTLGHKQIRNDLVKFYESQYSSNRINAVLCSSLSIQQMKKNLIHFFEQIQNKNLPKNKYDSSYEAQNVGKLVKMQSIKQQTIMEFFWPVQKLKNIYKKHIDQYISHILGHQGTNSLFSYLKNKGFASQISSYTHDIANQTLVGLQVKLTQQGQQNYQQVYNTVIDYTASLRPSKQIFEQIKQKKQVSFRFKQKTQTYQYVCDLSSKMHDVQLQEILNHKYLFEEFDEQTLGRVLKQLNPFNLIVVYSNSQEIQGSVAEKYLGGKYKVQNLPERRVYVQDFKNLNKNPFLPVNIQLEAENQDKQTPRKITQNILFLKDNNFKVCKGGVKIVLHGMTDPTQRQFYSEYLELLLKQLTYDAQTLHLQIIYDNEDSIQISIFGFNDTVLKLVNLIGQNIKSIHKSQNSQNFFTIALDKLLEQYENFYCGDVDQICQTTLDNILVNQNVDIPKSIQILQSYDYQSQTQQYLNFLGSCKVSWMFVGNFNQSQCVKLAQQFQSNLKTSNKLNDQEIKCLSVKKQTKHLTVLTSEEISTSGCIVYFNAGQYSEKLYYTLQLLKNHIEQPFFNQLRTQKQLAYYLTTRTNNTRGALGLYFILVSSSKDPQYISRQIKRFVFDFMGKIQTQLTQQKLQKLRQSVKTKFSVPHNNLKDMFNFVWKQISHSTYYFNRKQKSELDKHLQSITKKQMIDVWEAIKNNILQIQVLAKNHEEQFKKLNNSHEYSQFDQIKKGEYYDDIISKRKNNF